MGPSVLEFGIRTGESIMKNVAPEVTTEFLQAFADAWNRKRPANPS
jgi:hypothetical protein